MSPQHCWHSDNFQHSVPRHRDVFCCWCEKRVCQHADIDRLPDHGPHAPEVITGWECDADGQTCPERPNNAPASAESDEAAS